MEESVCQQRNEQIWNTIRVGEWPPPILPKGEEKGRDKEAATPPNPSPQKGGDWEGGGKLKKRRTAMGAPLGNEGRTKGSYLTMTFLPPTMLMPRCSFWMRWPARLKMGSLTIDD